MAHVSFGELKRAQLGVLELALGEGSPVSYLLFWGGTLGVGEAGVGLCPLWNCVPFSACGMSWFGVK